MQTHRCSILGGGANEAILATHAESVRRNLGKDSLFHPAGVPRRDYIALQSGAQGQGRNFGSRRQAEPCPRALLCDLRFPTGGTVGSPALDPAGGLRAGLKALGASPHGSMLRDKTVGK